MDSSLFESMYHDSPIELPGTPLHNKHINWYDHQQVGGTFRDDSPVYVPSKLNVFSEVKDLVYHTACKHTENPELSQCVIYINYPDAGVASSMLQVCRIMSQRAAITDLQIDGLHCDEIAKYDVFNLSSQPVSLMRICSSALPLNVMKHLLQQVSELKDIYAIDFS